MEVQTTSLRALATQKTTEEKHKMRLQEIKALDNKRLQAEQQIELYHAHIFRAFSKKVKERTLKKDNLVLLVQRPMVMTDKIKGKFEPKWGLFVIESVYSNEAYCLITTKGNTLLMPINGNYQWLE